MRKIIASGQTGVELAALDVARHLGMDCGGFATRGLRNDEGPIPDVYGLIEVHQLGYRHAMDQNVQHADGTLLITRGEKSSWGRDAIELSLKYQRQLLHIDLTQHAAFEAASLIGAWIKMQSIGVMYVTGPTQAQDSAIYPQTKKILETALYLEFVKTGLHPGVAPPLKSEQPVSKEQFPQNVEEAVTLLKDALPLKDRTLMANMASDELDRLRSGLGEYIKQNFGLYAGNEALLNACASKGSLLRPIPEEACAVILRALWEDLQSTHRLRIIK